MAKRRARANPAISLHPLAEAGKNQPLVILTGYFGAGAPDGSVRLFTDLSFRYYHDIRTVDIVVTSPAVEGDEYSKTRVFVRETAEVTPGQEGAEPASVPNLLAEFQVAAMAPPPAAGQPLSPISAINAARLRQVAQSGSCRWSGCE